MVQFNAGAQKTAVATLSNPGAMGFDYEAVLYLNITQVVKSEQSFSLAAGESKDVSFPIVMPVVPGIYSVWLDIRSSGELLAHYYAGDVEVVAFSGEFTVKVTNYGNLSARADASCEWVEEEFIPGAPLVWYCSLTANWSARIPSTLLYAGWPIRYLEPSVVEGEGMTQILHFLVPEGSEYWSPHPYVEIWLSAGPVCVGLGWSDALCRSSGLIIAQKVELTPGCEVIFDLSGF